MSETLETKLKALLAKKSVVLLGVGNPDRGDDGFGSLLARQIGSRAGLKSIVCEDVPENYTGVVRQYEPETIILADAIEIGSEPGDVVLLDAKSLTDDRFSSHKPSLKLLMDYLAMETGADTYLLGVQPGRVDYCNRISKEVKETLDYLKRTITELSQTAGEGDY